MGCASLLHVKIKMGTWTWWIRQLLGKFTQLRTATGTSSCTPSVREQQFKAYLHSSTSGCTNHSNHTPLSLSRLEHLELLPSLLYRYENNGAVPPSFTIHVLAVMSSTYEYSGLAIADADQDGDMDVFSGYTAIYLFENDGRMTFTRRLISNPLGGLARYLEVCDFNGDSFPDLLTVSGYGIGDGAQPPVFSWTPLGKFTSGWSANCGDVDE